VYNAGDELGWHMDRGEFAVTIHLQVRPGSDVVYFTVTRDYISYMAA
jgi:hypothetical protein